MPEIYPRCMADRPGVCARVNAPAHAAYPAGRPRPSRCKRRRCRSGRSRARLRYTRDRTPRSPRYVAEMLPRSRRDIAWGGQHQLAVQRRARQCALREESHLMPSGRHQDVISVSSDGTRLCARTGSCFIAVPRSASLGACLGAYLGEYLILRQSEVIPIGPEPSRRLVGSIRGHHEQRQSDVGDGHAEGGGGERAHTQHLLGVVLEQRLVRRQADIVAPLRCIGTEPCALTASEEEGSDLATACPHGKKRRSM